MGFSGGGGGVLTNHTHDTAVTNDGGALAANATMFGLSNQSILVSDGSNIQELTVGSDEQILKISGGALGWNADTGAAFVQVSKSYTDISSGEISIYTLAAANSISNMFVNITQVFSSSNAVTVGDSGDNDGFQQSTDWTTGTGLTGATRGTYITNFKGMRSTSGTTDIKAYNFTTGGVSTATYDSTLNESVRDDEVYDINFNNTGSKLYMAGSQHDKIYEYDLGPNYDVSTASFLQDLSVSAQDTNPYDIIFNNDGSKMYMSGTQNSKIYEYNLSTNYDISTASYLQDFSVSTQDSNPSGIAFNADGSKFFMAGYNTDFVYEYDLGTNYDITTAALSQSVNLSAFDTGLNGLRFNSDGTIMYTVGSQNDKVYQFTLSSGFDVSTVSFDQDFSVAAQTTNPTGLAFNATQTKMFVGFGGYVFEYNMDAPDTTGTVDFYLQVIS